MRRRRTVSTNNGGVSTASRIVSTGGMIQQVNIIIPSSSATKDKGKAIMTESEPEQTTTKLKQRQERAGYEAAIRLQEGGGGARIEADEELTQKLQVEEKRSISESYQARMLVDLINQRKRYFAAQKAEAKRNKPMTQAQQRTYMSKTDNKHIGKSHKAAIYTGWYRKGMRQQAQKDMNCCFGEEPEDIYLSPVEEDKIKEITSNMMIEKNIHLLRRMLSRMINRRLEVDHESEIAFELLRFIRSQLKK
ncbi:hypothetical protein Tco_1033392 [Tanacetum coccineum]